MSTLPDSVYDDAVRAYLRVPARHHISIGHLRATIDDPAAFRAALTVAYEAGAEDARNILRREADDLRQAHADLRQRVLHVVDTERGHTWRATLAETLAADTPAPTWVEPWPLYVACPACKAPSHVWCEVDAGGDRIGHVHDERRRAVNDDGIVAEARASVALDGETVTLDEPQVTP